MTVQQTDIVWCDYSANHWRACAKVSEGCANCWAANMADRFDRTPEPWTIDNIGENLQVYDEDLTEQLDRVEPGWVFMPSSSDPYLPWVPVKAHREWMAAIHANSQHCFQVLTKWGPEKWDVIPEALPPNAMLGVSVGTPGRTYRLDWLRKQPAHTKFVSFEPLVERIPTVDLEGIDWIIVGGESGGIDPDRYERLVERGEIEPDEVHVRREMAEAWAVELWHQARTQDTPILFKQHSGPHAEGDTKIDVGEGPQHIREFPETPEGVPDAPEEFI